MRAGGLAVFLIQSAACGRSHDPGAPPVEDAGEECTFGLGEPVLLSDETDRSFSRPVSGPEGELWLVLGPRRPGGPLDLVRVDDSRVTARTRFAEECDWYDGYPIVVLSPSGPLLVWARPTGCNPDMPRTFVAAPFDWNARPRAAPRVLFSARYSSDVSGAWVGTRAVLSFPYPGTNACGDRSCLLELDESGEPLSGYPDVDVTGMPAPLLTPFPRAPDRRSSFDQLVLQSYGSQELLVASGGLALVFSHLNSELEIVQDWVLEASSDSSVGFRLGSVIAVDDEGRAALSWLGRVADERDYVTRVISSTEPPGGFDSLHTGPLPYMLWHDDQLLAFRRPAVREEPELRLYSRSLELLARSTVEPEWLKLSHMGGRPVALYGEGPIWLAPIECL